MGCPDEHSKQILEHGKGGYFLGRVVVPDKSEQEMTGRDLSRMIE